MSDNLVNLHRVALETSSVCQLKCPSCPTASGDTGKSLGLGYLSLEAFKKLIDDNPQVSEVELSNWGEILLNKELPRLLEYAYRRNVGLYASNGVNLNHAPDETLEAMARWRLRYMRVSIDGGTPESYARYRVGGDFNTVLDHLRKLNTYKAAHKTRYPELEWQFVLFDHNLHEVETARALAKDLGMAFRTKLSWEDLYDRPFSPVTDKEGVRRAMATHVGDREEYRRKFHKHYVAGCCINMWNKLQINYDGRVLGCTVNYWGDYGNAFTRGLVPAAMGERLQYARDMLMGRKAPKPGIPCTTCKVYTAIREHKLWIDPEDIVPAGAHRRRLHYQLQNKVLGERAFDVLFPLYKQSTRRARGALRRLRRTTSLRSGVQPLPVPFPPGDEVWRSRGQFKGRAAAADFLTVHTSVLAPGCRPHRPHRHAEEELLLMLDGEADLDLPDHPRAEHRCQRLKAGEFVYYPAGFHHTLETAGRKPAVYTMFRWRGEAFPEARPLGFSRQVMTQAPVSSGNGGVESRLLFQGPTGILSKLRAHTTCIQPGEGYAPHWDPYDVGIVLMQGEVESLGRRMAAPAVFFYAAGDRHGMHNPGSEEARYLVFEFHPRRPPGKLRLRGLAAAAADPGRLKGILKHRWRNLV